MDYVVYCDESRHDGASKDAYMAIGGLWVPAEQRDTISREFAALKARVGLKAEVKWSKVSAKKLEAYKELVAFFLSKPELKFRVLVAKHGDLDPAKFHGGDKELGFYKFYYEMLNKWILAQNQYLILLDFKQNTDAHRYKVLKRVLDAKARGTAWIKDLTVIDSSETPLAQMVDLLTGAVCASWCHLAPESPKGQLAQMLATGLGRTSLVTPSATPDFVKFNVFQIALSGSGGA